MTMKFCMDIGNTHARAALVKDGRVLVSVKVPTKDIAAMCETAVWQRAVAEASALVVSSVVPDAFTMCEQLWRAAAPRARFYAIQAADHPELVLAYAQRHTLGTDRLVLIHHAAVSHPKDVVVIVDAGTAMTVDLVVSGAHVGGAIAPGFFQRAQSLQKSTAQLPLVPVAKPGHLWGCNTEECLASGVYYGVSLWLQALYDDACKAYLHKKVVMWGTGGDISLLSSTISFDRCDEDLMFVALAGW